MKAFLSAFLLLTLFFNAKAVSEIDLSQYIHFDQGIDYSIKNTSGKANLTGQYEISISCASNVECSFTTQSTGYAGNSITLDGTYYGWGRQINGRHCALNIPSGTHTLQFNSWIADDTHSTWVTLKDLSFKKEIPDLSTCLSGTVSQNISYSFVNSLSTSPWIADGAKVRSSQSSDTESGSFFYVTSCDTKHRSYTFTLNTKGSKSDYFYYQIDDKNATKYYGTQNKEISIVVNPLDHNVKFGFVTATGKKESYAEISNFKIDTYTQDLTPLINIEDGVQISVDNTANFPFYITDEKGIRSSNDINGLPGSYSSFSLKNENEFPIMVSFSNSRTQYHVNYDKRGIIINNITCRYYGEAENEPRSVTLASHKEMTFFNSFNSRDVSGGYLELKNLSVKRLVPDDLTKAMTISSGIDLTLDNSGNYPWKLSDDQTAIMSCDGVADNTESSFKAEITSKRGAAISFNGDWTEKGNGSSSTSAYASVYIKIDDEKNTVYTGQKAVFVPAGTHTITIGNIYGSHIATLRDFCIKEGPIDFSGYIVADQGICVYCENSAMNTQKWTIDKGKIQTIAESGVSTFRLNVNAVQDALCKFNIKCRSEQLNYREGYDSLFFSIDGDTISEIYSFYNNTLPAELYVPAGKHTVDIIFLRKTSYGYAAIDTIYFKEASADLSDLFEVEGNADIDFRNNGSRPWIAVGNQLYPSMKGIRHKNTNHSYFTSTIYVPKACTMSFDWMNENRGTLECMLNGESAAQITGTGNTAGVLQSVTLNLKHGENIVKFEYNEDYYTSYNSDIVLIKNIKIHSTDCDSTVLTTAFNEEPGVSISFENEGEWVVDRGMLRPTIEKRNRNYTLVANINTSKPLIFSFDYAMPSNDDMITLTLEHDGVDAYRDYRNYATPKIHRRLYLPTGQHRLEFFYYISSYTEDQDFAYMGNCELTPTSTISDGQYTIDDYIFTVQNGAATLTDYSGPKRGNSFYSSGTTMTLPEDFQGIDYSVSASAIAQVGSGCTPYADTYEVPEAVYSMPVIALTPEGDCMGEYYNKYKFSGYPLLSFYGGSGFENYNANFGSELYVPYHYLSYYKRSANGTGRTRLFPKFDFIGYGSDYTSYALAYADDSHEDLVFLGLSETFMQPDSIHIPAMFYDYERNYDIVELYSLFYGSSMYYSYSQQNVVMESKVPQRLSQNFLSNYMYSASFFVPNSSYNRYKKADGWKDLSVSKVVSFNSEQYEISIVSEEDKTCELSKYTGDNSNIDLPATIINPDNGESYTLVSIGSRAFEEVSDNLTSITIPEGVETIEDGAFENCCNMQEVSLPSTLKEIEDNAFSNCNNITEIEIPSSLESIGEGTFSSLELKEISVDDNNTNFTVENNLLYTKDMQELVLCPTKSEAKEVTINENTKLIQDKAFCRCENIETVTMPNSVELVGTDAFLQCRKLKTLTLSASTKIIKSNAFSECNMLSTVTCPASELPIVESNAFGEESDMSDATLYVPAPMVETYMASATWRNFGNIFAIEETIIENINCEPQKTNVRKYIHDGHIIIEKNGHTYNVAGVKMVRQ